MVKRVVIIVIFSLFLAPSVWPFISYQEKSAKVGDLTIIWDTKSVAKILVGFSDGPDAPFSMTTGKEKISREGYGTIPTKLVLVPLDYNYEPVEITVSLDQNEINVDFPKSQGEGWFYGISPISLCEGPWPNYRGALTFTFLKSGKSYQFRNLFFYKVSKSDGLDFEFKSEVPMFNRLNGSFITKVPGKKSLYRIKRLQSKSFNYLDYIIKKINKGECPLY